MNVYESTSRRVGFAVCNSDPGQRKKVSCRKAVSDDRGFIQTTYFSTRHDIQNSTLDERLKKQILQQQFRLKTQFYLSNYPDSLRWIINRFDEPVGYLEINFTDTEVRLIDIAIQTQFRNQGIGTEVLGRLQGIAEGQELPLRIRVLSGSPATRWYRRSGFKLIGQDTTHLHMEWFRGKEQ